MQGKGTFTWPDGRKFKGDYDTEKKNGFGEFTWPNGRTFKGTWIDGKQHGLGTFFTAEG